MQRKLTALALAALVAAAGCKKEDKPATRPEIEIAVPSGGFVADQLKWIRITPEVRNGAEAAFLWKLGEDTIGTEKDLMHLFKTAGTYQLRFSARNTAGEVQQGVTVKINANTSYVNGVTRVFEYLPAPGQFVNTLPVWEVGESAQAMAAKAEEALKNDVAIHLGGFGGYVVMGFDHTILNVPDHYSFNIKGNAFTNWAEPGIIMVASDVNGNGLPDDEWYEIAGAEYDSSTTRKNYQVTYYKPDENKEPTPSLTSTYVSDTTYIRWRDNHGNTGYVSKNVFHDQSYYPQWMGDSITFTGTRLRDNIHDLSGNGSYYVSPAFAFGYADNWGNGDERSNIKISWAVDKDGKPVKLKGIDFIKVYTGILAEGGWLGEVSTEISSVKDLNL